MTRALALFSGSLASRVAARVVARQVDELFLLHFRSPFFADSGPLRELVKEEWPGVPLRTQSLKKEYRRMANIPPRGSFALTRSCLSCRTIILMRAARYMERLKADFIVTGEIAGQRGLSADDLTRIDEALGITGLVLRPLSAHLLPPTQAERVGWVERKHLFGLKEHDSPLLPEIAARLGIVADGDPFSAEMRCKLTFPGFGARLESLLTEEHFNLNAIRLLDFRLYYRCPPDVKIVLAATEEEKRALQDLLLPQDLRVYLPTYPGPMAMVRTNWLKKTAFEVREIVELAGRIAATHSSAPPGTLIPVSFRFERDDETSQLNVLPFSSPAAIEEYCTLYAVEFPDRGSGCTVRDDDSYPTPVSSRR